MTIHVSGEARGCGSLQKGGCYATSEFGPGGTLLPWSWILGQPWLTGLNVLAAGMPPRVQVEINPQATLKSAYLWLAEWKAAADPSSDIPTWGLADHVGSKFYTPLSFAEECRQRGPSRRLTPANAKKWAAQVPFPIFFTTNVYPLWASQAAAEDWLYNCLSKDSLEEGAGKLIVESSNIYFDWNPTWKAEGWGLSKGCEWGELHTLAAEGFHYLDLYKGRVTPQPEHRIEAVFGASWITHIVQVLDEADEVSEDLAQAGVVKAVIK